MGSNPGPVSLKDHQLVSDAWRCAVIPEQKLAGIADRLCIEFSFAIYTLSDMSIGARSNL